MDHRPFTNSSNCFFDRGHGSFQSVNELLVCALYTCITWMPGKVLFHLLFALGPTFVDLEAPFFLLPPSGLHSLQQTGWFMVQRSDFSLAKIQGA